MYLKPINSGKGKTGGKLTEQQKAQLTQQKQRYDSEAAYQGSLAESYGAMNFAKSVGSKIGGFVADIPRYVARTALSVGLSTGLGKSFEEDGKRTIDPKEFGAEKFLKGDIIESLGTRKKRYDEFLKSKGFENTSPLSISGVAGITALDAMFGSGKKSKTVIDAAKTIASEKKSVQNILKDLKNFKISGQRAKEMAPVLLSETDPNKIAVFIKSAEIIEEVEKKTKLSLPEPIKVNIGKMLSENYFKNSDEVEQLSARMIDDLVSTAPKANPRTLKLNEKISAQIPNLDPEDVDEFGAIDDFKKIQEALSNPKLRSSQIESFERQAEDIVEEVLKRRGEKIAPKIMREKELAALFSDAKNYPTFTEFQLGMKKAGKDLEKLFKSKSDAENFFKAATVRREAFGVFAGVEQDENGNISIDPVKAGLGVLGIQVARKLPGIPGLPGKTGLKKVGLATKENKIVRTERQLLKTRVRAESQTAKKVAVNVRREVKSDIKKKVAEKFSKQTAKREILRDVSQLQKILRQKGLTAQSNIQLLREFGISTKQNPVKHFNREILMRLSDEKLLRVKEILKGFLKNDAPKIDYSKVNVGKFKLGETVSRTRRMGEAAVQVGENVLSSISTNIEKYGGKLLKYAGIRRYLFDKSRIDITNQKTIEGFVKGIDKMKSKWFGRGKKDYDTMTYALYNRDFETARRIAEENGFLKEFESVQKLLAKTRQSLVDAGVPVGELENYFPRVVSDYDGLYQAYKKKFGQDGDKFLDSMLRKYAAAHYKKVETLTPEERADVLNKAFRGYGDRINPGVGKMTQARKFNELTDDLIDYYYPPENSLDLYLKRASEKVALMKLLGTGDDINASIGKLVEGMDMTPNGRILLADNLKSLLQKQGEENGISRAIRTISTVTLLSNINSAITQLADISANVLDHGWIRSLASIFRNKPIKRDEVIESLMAELQNGNFTTNMLKATGFDRLDRLNVESRMGNDFRKGMRAMRSPGSKEFDEVSSDLNYMFQPEEIPQVMKDFADGKVTDLTRFYVFNKVLDVSPRAISEMPKAYIDNPNLRSLYSMKSYSIKVLDIYRNRVIREKKTVKRVTQFLYITGTLMAAGMGADQVKDWWNGKDTDMSDMVANNFLKIFMLSQYDLTNIQQDGIGSTLLAKALPPTRVINDIGKDIYKLFDGKDDNETFNTVRNIPIVGGEIYNRVGTGAESIKKSNRQTTSAKDIAYGISQGKLTKEQKDELVKMQKANPAGYSRVKKYIKWNKLGITEEEEKIASMDVIDGERAKAIVKYLKESKNKNLDYQRLRSAGIISDDVQKQVKYLLKK